jgi:ADP-ribose pyrophosphatase YjhB (NUDIX family)
VGLSVGELGAVDTRVFAVDDLGVTVGENSPVEPPLSNSAGGSRGPASGTSAGISAGSSAGSFAATPQGTSHQESTRVLAFDHDVILGDAIERVRAKFEYTTVATSLVTEPFTVPELRRVYESVWGVNLHPANFRRKVLATPGFVVSSALSDGDGVEGGERRGPDLFRRGTAALLHPAMLRPAPSDE